MEIAAETLRESLENAAVSGYNAARAAIAQQVEQLICNQ